MIRLFRAIEFFVAEAVVNVRRHGLMSLAAVAIVAFVFLLVGLFGLVLTNLRWNAAYAAGEVEIFAHLDRDASLDDAHVLRADILDLEGVESARVISRDEVFKDFMSRHAGGQSWRNIPNKFGHEVRVAMADPQQVPSTAEQIEQLRGVRKVVYGGPSARSLLRFVRWLNVGVAAIGVLLALAVLGIVHSTIRLTMFARRREISIMQMVGATPTYVAGPFLLEGAFHGTLGSGIASGLLFLAYDYLVGLVPQGRLLHPVPQEQLIWGFWGMVIAGFVLGVLGSLLSVRRFLHRPVVA